MLGWFWSLCARFGIYRSAGRLLLLGLDNAGKTTLLHLLKDEHLAVHAPTQRTTQEELVIGTLKLTCFDLGGHEEAREIWKDYFLDVTAIIYIVDAHDRKRLHESYRELSSILTDESLKDVPIAVLGNKIDHPLAVSEPEFRRAMGVEHTTGKATKVPGGMRPLEVFMASIANKAGYTEALDWLSLQVE